MRCSDRSIRSDFREDCDKFIIKPLLGLAGDSNGTIETPKARYFSSLQNLMRQLCTDNIRSVMKFRRIVHRPDGTWNENDMIVSDYALITKECVDGYCLKGGRNMELGTTTNISIQGAAHSTDASDILFIADMNEDRYSRSLITQQSDKENLIFLICGLVDINCGEPITVITTKAEDSKSLQYAIGKGGPTSSSRLLWTRFPWKTLSEKWRTSFSTISTAAGGCHYRWLMFERNHLIPKCNEDFPNVDYKLVPFAKTSHCERIKQHKEEYMKAHQWMINNISKAGLQASDWMRASSIRQMSVEPLHCGLRIFIIVIKYLIIGVLDYCGWICAEDQEAFQAKNHGATDTEERLPGYSKTFILKHFRECCHLPFIFDEDNPSNSTLRAGLSIAYTPLRT